jgi:hypothetical protein
LTSSGNTPREIAAMYAKRLFDFYPSQEAGNPEVILAGVVDLFCHYPMEVAERAVSPVFGLPRAHKFMPRIAEISEFLEKAMGPLREDQYRKKIVDDARALLAPPARRMTYDELKAKFGENWGLASTTKSKPGPFLSVAQLKQIAGDAWDKIPDAK